jgi:hypothetical protein
MMRTMRKSPIVVLMLSAATLLGGNVPFALAVDGVVLIDQNRALAGNVTPGDAPGFPVTLSRAGSYRLSGNLTVPDENTTAISITASNVTVDLNGFSILGPTVCSGSGSNLSDPITCIPASGGGFGVRDPDDGSITGSTVVNGTVQGMGGGIALHGHARVENVHAVSNRGNGIVVRGLVVGSTAFRNLHVGILAATGTVSGCTARDNGTGIGGEMITVTGNTVSGNFHGIAVGSGSAVIGNVAADNAVGLELDSGSGYTHNLLSNNSLATVSGTGTSLGQNLCNGVIC